MNLHRLKFNTLESTVQAPAGTVVELEVSSRIWKETGETKKIEYGQFLDTQDKKNPNRFERSSENGLSLEYNTQGFCFLLMLGRDTSSI